MYTSEEFYGKLSEEFNRAPITIRKRLAVHPHKQIVERGRVKYYFTENQLDEAKKNLKATDPFVGRGNYQHTRRNK